MMLPGINYYRDLSYKCRSLLLIHEKEYLNRGR